MQRQAEAHQLLIFPFTTDQGHKRHIEHTLPAADAYELVDDGQLGQRLVGDGMIATDIALAHIDKLRIVDADTIRGVSIVSSQRELSEHDWQDAVNPDLGSGQVNILLCSYL